MASTAPVLVVGGGPTGLVAALTLLQSNIPVRIIAKELEHRPGQRGSGIWPRTFEVFHFLHAFETHQHARLVPPAIEYKIGSVKPQKTFTLSPFNEPTPSTPYNNLMMLGQSTLESILRSHLEKYGCSVELGTELQSFEDDGGRVLAKLIKRKDGEETSETYEASYLIGADGAKSVTRKQLGLTFLGETRQDFFCLVGDLCLEIEGVDRKHWHFFGQRFSDSDFFMLRPTDEIAPDGFQFIMTAKKYESKQVLADEKLVVKCISELTGKEINIRKIPFLSEFRINIRMVDKFGAGRVFVAGDAAHVHSPTGGQGLNTSIQDAFNLAWKLSLVCKALSPATLLDSYTTERLPVIAEMLNISTGVFNEMRSNPSAFDNLSRDKRLTMLGVNYRTSPLVLDEFTQAAQVGAYGTLEEGVLVAGDRAPDAPELCSTKVRAISETDTRLFDLFSPAYHTVLLFVPDMVSTTDVLEVLGKYPGDVIRPVIVLPRGVEVTEDGIQVDVVIDRGGHAYQGYFADKGEKKVVVVRPDGVVGAMVRNATGVTKYFSKIFCLG